MKDRTTKKVTVSSAAVRKSVTRATRASAKLEGRAVTPGYKRSANIEAYIARRSRSTRDDSRP